MRVLRNGGHFTDSRIDFYFAKTLRYLLLAALVLVGFNYLHLHEIGLVAGALLLISAKGSYHSWSRWFLGKKGESKVIKTLNSLPSDYVVLNDVVLPDSKGNVDHVLIGPNGVFAIETKNYSGYVKCEEEQWFVNGRSIRSLSKQAKRNAMAVRSSIGSLFTGPRTSIPYVVPLLVFVSSHTKLKLFKPTVSVLRLGELVEFICDCGTKRPITSDEKRAIVYHLQSLQPTFREFANQGAIANDDLYGLT
jgi:hypothetical protein